MNAFLRSPLLTHLTSRHPHVEFLISPRPGKHPVLKAQYVNGRQKAVCVKNMRVEEIKAKCGLLLGNDGSKNKRVAGRKVVSANEGVRGLWSALHGGIKDI
jgi:large subunit ribosomal protein L43